MKKIKYISVAAVLAATSSLQAQQVVKMPYDDNFSLTNTVNQSDVQALIQSGFKTNRQFLSTLDKLAGNNVGLLTTLYQESLGKIPKDKSEFISTRIQSLSSIGNVGNIKAASASGATVSSVGTLGAILGGVALVGAAAGGGGGGSSSGSSGDSGTNDSVTDLPAENPSDDYLEIPKDENNLGNKDDDSDTIDSFELIGQFEFDDNHQFKMTNEQSRNLTFEMTKGYVPHAMGLTGKGSQIAMLDSGFINHTEFNGANIIGGNSIYDDPDNYLALGDHNVMYSYTRHGLYVLGAMAAQANNQGTVGYAPGADYYIVRIASRDGVFGGSSHLLANAFKYALDNNSNIINNSWSIRSEVTEDKWNRFSVISTYHPMYLEFKRAVENDVVVVWAAGNNSWENPSLSSAMPYHLPELTQAWLNVVSVNNQTGLLSDYSNKCGVSYEYCLSVPANRIYTTGSNNSYTYSRGTSLAAPIASASIALVKEQFPMLTYQQSAQRLLLTANKQGVYADYLTYGQGLLDLENAMNPLGQTYLMTASGFLIPTENSSIRYSSAFSNSPFKESTTMIVDEQGAGFTVDLSNYISSSNYRLNNTDNLATLSSEPVHKKEHSTSMNIQQSFVDNKIQTHLMSIHLDDATLMMGLTKNTDDFSHSWNQEPRITQNSTMHFSSPYITNNDQSNDHYLYGIKYTQSLDKGDLELSSSFHHKTHNVSAAYTHKVNEYYHVKAELGLSKSNEGLFGMETTGSLSHLTEQNTRYIGVSGQYQKDNFTLDHAFHLGKSKGDKNDFIEIDDIISSHWSIGASYKKDSHQFGLNVTQPLRVENAQASMSVVTGYQQGQYQFDNVNVNLKPSARQINSEVYWQHTPSDNSTVRVSLMNVDNPGHSKQKSDQSIMMTYRLKF